MRRMKKTEETEKIEAMEKMDNRMLEDNRAIKRKVCLLNIFSFIFSFIFAFVFAFVFCFIIDIGFGFHFLIPQALADNLGVWGPVYPIQEEDFLVFINERLNQLKKNGELDQMKAQFINNVSTHTLRPSPVQGLTTTISPRIFFYNPTFVLQKNIENAAGTVIISAGTKVNPLDQVELHSVLLFFNADDKNQVAWAKEQSSKFKDRVVKLILVQGNIKTSEDEFNRPIYFDQYGSMTEKLGLQHIPCLVQQAGRRLVIQEYAMT